MPTSDKQAIVAAATAAGLPGRGFSIEVADGTVFVNHPDSMKRPEKWPAVKDAVERVTGMKVSIT